MASLARTSVFGHWRVLEVGCLLPDDGPDVGFCNVKEVPDEGVRGLRLDVVRLERRVFDGPSALVEQMIKN